MGLFSKHKDKGDKGDKVEKGDVDQAEKPRPDLLNPTPTAPPPTSSTPGPASSHNNSYHDSTYYSIAGSNASNDEQRRGSQRPPGQAPGTTVTTTTTTTTTTVTVTSDGQTYTSTHPYNPATDPPVKTQETTVIDSRGSNSPVNGPSNTNSTHSSTTVPQTIPEANLNTQNLNTQPTPATSRPPIQRLQSPGRKPTPQDIDSNSHLNIIPPTPLSSQSTVPGSPTTSGGRTIPPRSDLRSSPNANKGSFRGNDNGFGPSSPNDPNAGFLNNGPLSPGPPMRSEKRNSIDRGLSVAPLKTSHSPSNSGGTPTATTSGYNGGQQTQPSYPPPPPKDSHFMQQSQGQNQHFGNNQNQQFPNGQDQHYPNGQDQSYIPTAGSSEPLASGGLPAELSARSHTPNYSRPSSTVSANPPHGPPPHLGGGAASTGFDAPPTSADAMYTPAPTAEQSAKLSHRQSLASTLKGFQGASEMLRGSINSGIAKTTHDKAEQERQRAIREQGLRDYRESGLQERIAHGREMAREKTEERRRLRKRSLSRGVHGREGPGGLEAVEERSI